MKREMINIAGRDYAPILVGFGECCLNCDVNIKHCLWQCHDFEEQEDENVALKEVLHKERPTKWQKIREFFMPIESDTPF